MSIFFVGGLGRRSRPGKMVRNPMAKGTNSKRLEPKRRLIDRINSFLISTILLY
jgi:hypothetical protein